MKKKYFTITPKGLNVYSQLMLVDVATPTGSYILHSTLFYKHFNPSDCVNQLKQATI